MRKLSLRTAEETEQEASRVRNQMETLQGTNARLTNELDSQRSKLDKAGILAKDLSHSRALVVELQVINSVLKNKAEQLAGRNDRLATEQYASSEAREKNKTGFEFSRAKPKNNEHEMKALREKLAAAEADRDWHRSEHTKMLEVRNALNAERGHDSPQLARLKGDITKLKKDKEDLGRSIHVLKGNIAYYITHLDLADANFRVFACRHEGGLDAVPDKQNTTRQKTALQIATEFFKEYADDGHFISEYHDVRQYLLEHHRAHERVGQGRGSSSGRLKDKMIEVDVERGANITYS
ncbi:uncharacterized protein K460DRAFT_340560 [Cucurbitaria berberidis CBS 394.84]|uniref:Uncharacterized protein n=1 Tax=Cucurbitaria berberidis CBS 394.84 TaxID=1168544 RepID=A0A9P4L637_9PLEO|nr:uncharacterized protein K460DRAFT_340560 [Cucurbitaria berberidis CBS 394.84]KAF1842962.1 hypothetical protein K460DRAFT_340560 [Cucurbitaria berberidis CBS 394.84]